MYEDSAWLLAARDSYAVAAAPLRGGIAAAAAAGLVTAMLPQPLESVRHPRVKFMGGQVEQWRLHGAVESADGTLLHHPGDLQGWALPISHMRYIVDWADAAKSCSAVPEASPRQGKQRKRARSTWGRAIV